jgi:hypothetical protein
MNPGPTRAGAYMGTGPNAADICQQPGPYLRGKARSQTTPGSKPAQGHSAAEGDAGSGTLATMEIQRQADQASADEFFESVAKRGASSVPGALTARVDPMDHGYR